MSGKLSTNAVKFCPVSNYLILLSAPQGKLAHRTLGPPDSQDDARHHLPLSVHQDADAHDEDTADHVPGDRGEWCLEIKFKN